MFTISKSVIREIVVKMYKNGKIEKYKIRLIKKI